MRQEKHEVAEMSVREAQEFARDVVKEVGKKIFEMDDIVRFCLIATYTDGHVLLEGNPGLGKTALVKTLGSVLNLPKGTVFQKEKDSEEDRTKRIQFTPDLMPSDVTGTEMPDINLEFVPGPVFTSLLLADEINRATPKTQSAMLEAMAEYQVTVLSKTYTLRRPFLVLATQNPIEHAGTYDLPEAQLDRFMFKLNMSPPSRDVLVSIIDKETKKNEINVGPVNNDDPTLTYERLAKTIKQVIPHPAVQKHICNIVQASNQLFDELDGLKRGEESRIRAMADYFRYGLGPRAAINLMKAAKAWSLLFSDTADAKTDLRCVASVAIPTLRHRAILKYDWKEKYRGNKMYRWSGGDKQDNVLLDRMLAEFCLATAPIEIKPREEDYYHLVEDTLKQLFPIK